MSMSITLTSNSYHSKYVWFIHLLIHFHKFSKMLIILMNETSKQSKPTINCDSCLNPYFILMLLLYFCLFHDHINKPIIFVFRAVICHFKNTFSIWICVELCGVGIKTIKRVVKYEHNEFFKLWMWVEVPWY